MNDERPIMVATDLSARDDRAVDRAIALGRSRHHRVHVVHVTRPTIGVGIADVRATLPDPDADVEVMLPVGSAPETIVRTAAEIGAALIVTGVARFNHLGDYFLGTAVDHVLRHAPAPVLIVKQRPHGDYRRMLVAVDLSDHSGTTLMTAARLFPEAAIDLVHSYHIPFPNRLDSPEMRAFVQGEAQTQLDAFLVTLPAPVRDRLHIHMKAGETGSVIAKAIDDTGADLVVLGTHGVSGFVHATLGSTTSSLLTWIKQDTLVVGRPAAAG